MTRRVVLPQKSGKLHLRLVTLSPFPNKEGMGFGDHNLNLPDGENFAPSEAKVKAMAELLSSEPFHLGVPSRNREAWDRWQDHSLGQYWAAEALSHAEKEPVRVTDDLMVESHQKDDRAIHDLAGKAMRDRLTAMTMTECIEPTGKYISFIEEDLIAFCGLKTWVNPAHDDEGKNFRGETIEVDLGSGQWAMLFAAIDYLLGDRLNQKVHDLIRAEIDRRILGPFRTRIETGQDIYWWVTCEHNWNTVCLNCILDCALYLKDDIMERAWYLALIDDLIEYSNRGFEESGFYTEGMSYWTYGFGNYVAISELVRSATNGQINWLKEPLQHKMALYGIRMEVQQGLFPTFADSRLEFEPVEWLTHWLNNCQDDDPARIRATKDKLELFAKPDQFMLNTALLNMFHTVDGQKAYKMDYGFPAREWFDDVQFLICRPRKDATVKLAATFKGGHNGVNHNHNDLGTFTVAIDNKYLIVDPGLEIYTSRTFSPKRYESNLLNSFGHPVPVIAGELQVPGKDEHRSGGYGSHAHATVVETAFSEECDRVILDLTKAYEVDSLTSLTREFAYERSAKGHVEIKDDVAFSQPESFETAIITYAEWKLNEDGSLTISDGDAAVKVIVTSEAGELEFAHCIIKETATPTRLSWRLKDPVQQARVKINVSPL